MHSQKQYPNHAVNIPVSTTKRAVRKHLNVDTLLAFVRNNFQKVTDNRAGNSKISIDDALMSALAMFQLKEPSLLAFDKRCREEQENLHTHGSWLNIAEIELSVLKRQYLAGRIDCIEKMRRMVAAWNTDRNNRQFEVD